MSSFYLTLFFIGTLYTGATFLLGHLGQGHSDAGDFDGTGLHGADAHGLDGTHGHDFHANHDAQGHDPGIGHDAQGFDAAQGHDPGIGHDAQGFDAAQGHDPGIGHDAQGFDAAQGHDPGAGPAHVHGAPHAHDFDAEPTAPSLETDALDIHGANAHTLAHAHSSLLSLLPLNAPSLALLCAAGGGAGYSALYLGAGQLVAAIWALACGLGGAFGLHLLILRPLKRAQNSSAATQRDIMAALGVVTSPILEGGYGRIRYTARGNLLNAPARSADGTRLEQGTRVAILRLEGPVHIVIPIPERASHNKTI